MAQWEELFEGAADGTAITTSNTALSNVNTAGGTVTFSTLQAAEGTRSARIQPTAGAAVVMRRDHAELKSLVYRRFYVYIATNLSGTTSIIAQQSSDATNACQIQRNNTSGVLSLRDMTGPTTVATSTTALAVGAWMRLEWCVDVVNTLQTLRLFTGANLNGFTPDETISGAYTMGNFNRSHTGIVTGTAGDIFYDAWGENYDTWVGPYGATDPDPGYGYVLQPDGVSRILFPGTTDKLLLSTTASPPPVVSAGMFGMIPVK